jgi:hypothetical protein
MAVAALAQASPELAKALPDSTVSLEDVSFSHIYVFIEGGKKHPVGDLADAVDNSFYMGLGFRYTYWENFDGIILFQYSYFEPHFDVPRINGVHEVSGKLGLDYRWNMIAPIVFGAGFLCNWTRADYDGDKKAFDFNNDYGATLTDNETEFGWFARLNLPVFTYGNYRAGMNVSWEQLWTLPERSNMLVVGLYVERRIW